MSEASPEKGENLPKTQLLFGDSSVQSFKHSHNRAACVAVTAALQTFAGIAKKLEIVESIEFCESKKPDTEDLSKYCVFLDPESELTSKLISGVFWAIKSIGKQCPGSLEVHDSRKNVPVKTKVNEDIVARLNGTSPLEAIKPLGKPKIVLK